MLEYVLRFFEKSIVRVFAESRDVLICMKSREVHLNRLEVIRAYFDEKGLPKFIQIGPISYWLKVVTLTWRFKN